MMAMFQRLVCHDEGQDLVEYALLCTFIAIICVIAVNALGDAISNVFTVVANQLKGS
jgi:Flp pilus assembly pilin Flp